MTANVIKSGNPITFAVVPGMNGMPATAHHLDLFVYDDKQEVVWLSGVSPVLWADAVASGVVFPGAASTITEGNAYRIFGYVIVSAEGVPLWKVYHEVIVESSNQLRPLENSFGTWGELILESRTIAGATAFACCTVMGVPDKPGPGGEGNAALVAAFINAYHNIGYVNVDFCPPRSRGRWISQSHMWDGEGIFESDIGRITSTRQLTQELWDKLKLDQRQKLIRAQVIEANFLLSGNTPEKQRLSGLLSHSAGESAHFYRTSKPLELPVCRATANALKGIITYVTRIGG